MSPQVNIVNSREEWEWVRWMLRAAEWIVFDLETTSSRGGLEDWHPDSRIVSASFTTEAGTAWVMPFAHPEARHGVEPAEVFDELVGHKLANHNVKYDARWVHSTTGVNLMPWLAWDVMAAAFLENENRKLGLKPLAMQELNVGNWDDKDAKLSPDQVPLEQLAQYNGLDTIYAWDLHALQRDRFRTDHRLARLMWYVLMPAIRALGEIEQEGMLIDPERARERLEENQQTISEIEAALQAAAPASLLRKYSKHYGQMDLFTGEESELGLSWAPTSKFFGEWTEAMGWPVLERSDAGKPSWRTAVLKKLAKKGVPHARELIQHRKLVKQRDAFLTPWTADLAGDSKVHPTYRPTKYDEGNESGGTTTGRTACDGPNLQQVARELKSVFIAEPGWQLLQADESQIEVRVVAHVSGDQNLIDLYVQDRDVYRETGARVFDVAYDEVSKDQRQQSKPVVLGFLYGMGWRTFMDYAAGYDVDVTPEQSQHMRRAFFDLFPGLLVWHERMKRLVRQQGFVESPLGRRRHLPEARSNDPAERAKAERRAINAPIQSFASDIMLLSLDRIRREVPRELFRPCGTVHDSVLGYVREDAAEQVARQVGEILVTPDLSPWGVELAVPLAAEVEWGPSWGELGNTIKVSSNDVNLRRVAA